MSDAVLEDTIYDDAVSFTTKPYDSVYPKIDSSIVNLPVTLQRLPRNNSMSDNRLVSTLNFNSKSLASEREQFNSTSLLNVDPSTTSSSTTSSSTILKDASFKILQTKLSLEKDNQWRQQELETIKRLDRPMYYKPPSHDFKDGFYGIKDCLPPNVKLNDQSQQEEKDNGFNKATKLPIFINAITAKRAKESNTHAQVLQSIRNEINEDDIIDDDDPNNDNPQGSWENPIVKEAISRQINLEYQMKSLIRNIIYLMIFILFKSSISKLLVLLLNARSISSTKESDSQLYNYSHNNHMIIPQSSSSSSISVSNTRTIAFYFVLITKLIIGYFIISIIIAGFKLLKGQDQCYDLPLTIHQRKLLGLKVNDVPEDYIIDEKAEMILKQRRYDLLKNKNNDKNKDKLVNMVNNQQSIPKYKKLNDYYCSSYYDGINNNAEEEQEQLQDSMFNIDPQVNDKYNDGALIKNQSLYQPRHGSTFNNSIELNTQASTLGLKFLGNQTTFGSHVNYNTQNKNMNSKYSSQTIQKAQSKFEKNFDIQFNCN